MSKKRVWDCDDESRATLALAVRSLPNFVAGNGVFTEPEKIIAKLDAFSNLLVNDLFADGHGFKFKVSNTLASRILQAHLTLVENNLMPGCYLDSRYGDTCEFVNLIEIDGFLCVNVKWLSNDRVSVLPVDYFKIADKHSLSKKLRKKTALQTEKPDGGVEAENKKIDSMDGGINKHPKFINFVSETEEDLDLIQRDLDAASFPFEMNSCLEEAWDFRSVLPWRLFFSYPRVRVAKTEAGFIYAVEDLEQEKDEDGSFARLLEISNNRVLNWQLNNGVSHGSVLPLGQTKSL